RGPTGFVQQSVYDARGNPLIVTAVNPYGTGQNAVTTYTWDAVFDHVKTITLPEGEVTTFSYLANTGLLDWQQPGSSSARRVNFYYNSDLMLQGVRSPGPPIARDTITYDSLGNVR